MKLGLGLGNDLHGHSIGGVFGGLDPATQALLDQAVTDGYTAASGDTLTALDEYIKGLKEDGIWDKLDILYVFATNGDSDFATYNIKDPANFQATKVNAPTFTSLEGFVGDGVSSFLNTGFDLNAIGINWSDTNGGIIGGYFRDLQSSDGYEIGTGNDTYLRAEPIVSRVRIKAASSSLLQFTGSFANGMLAMFREDSATISIYDNTTPLINSSALSANSTSGTELAFLSFNAAGVATSSNQISIGYVGGIKSDADYLALTAATEAYMDALGKGVV